MKKLLIVLLSSILCIIINPSSSYSQWNWNQWEDEYWVVRDMLVNDFMVIGDCPGCGIIINKRKLSYVADEPFDWNKNLLGSIDVNDEPFPLGIYMGILATEWKLLNDGGIGTTDVEQELFYAIQTIKRLDRDAEYYWRKYYNQDSDPVRKTSDLNGFFIADDLFSDFFCYDCDHSSQGYQNFLKLNSNNSKYSWQESGMVEEANFKAGKYIGISTLPYDRNSETYMDLATFNNRMLQKTFPDPEEDDYNGFSGAMGTLNAKKIAFQDTSMALFPGPREMSQDHAIWLLMGLATIVNCIPSSVSVTGKMADGHSETLFIKNEAQKIIDNIITWLYWPKGILDDESAIGLVWTYADVVSLGLTGKFWMIKNPITHRCVKGVHWPEAIENNDYLNFDGMNVVLCNGGGSEAVAYAFGYKEILDIYGSGSISTTGWLGLNASKISYTNNVSLENMSAVQLALTDIKETLTTYIFGQPLPNNYHSHNDVAQYGWSHDEFKYLDALYTMLHSSEHLQIENTQYAEYFNSASCPQYTDANNAESANIYPQLVYMFTHNLIRVLNSMPYSRAKKVFDPSQAYPNILSNQVIGGQYIGGGNPLPASRKTVTAVYELKSKAYLNGCPGGIASLTNADPAEYSADVEYIAGNKITLLPGFFVGNYARFSARIEDMEEYCHYAVLNNKSLVVMDNTRNSRESERMEKEEENIPQAPEKEGGIIVYPNPTEGQVTVCIKGLTSKGHIKVLDAFGVELQSFDLYSPCSNIRLDVPAGFYFITVITNDNTYCSKIIVD